MMMMVMTLVVTTAEAAVFWRLYHRPGITLSDCHNQPILLLSTTKPSLLHYHNFYKENRGTKYIIISGSLRTWMHHHPAGLFQCDPIFGHGRLCTPVTRIKDSWGGFCPLLSVALPGDLILKSIIRRDTVC